MPRKTFDRLPYGPEHVRFLVSTFWIHFKFVTIILLQYWLKNIQHYCSWNLVKNIQQLPGFTSFVWCRTVLKYSRPLDQTMSLFVILLHILLMNTNSIMLLMRFWKCIPWIFTSIIPTNLLFILLLWGNRLYTTSRTIFVQLAELLLLWYKKQGAQN